MWSEPQTGREREKGRLIFFTLSAQFPLYFLPEDPCLQNVQSMLSMDRRLWNLPEQKKYEKKKGREKRSSSLLHCNTERWSYYPENLTTLFFSLFIPEFPEHWATITTRILGPHTGYPLWRWGRRKTQTLLVAKCIGLYFCPASRLIGVHVRQPMVVWGWGSTVGRNIRTVG